MVASLEKTGKARFSRKAVINGRQWSPYQRAFFDECEKGSGHIFLDAGAGAGKSSSIVGAIAHLSASLKIAVVAFNNHSVNDLEAKLPSSVSVSTAHRFGLSALVRYFGGKPFKPNDTKYRDLCRRGVDALAKELQPGSFAAKDLDLFINGQESKNKDLQREGKAIRRAAASYLESIIHYGMATLSNWQLGSLLEMDNHFVIEKDFSRQLTEELLKFVPRIVNKGLDAATNKQDVSLDELLYLPVKLDLSFPAYDFVFWDEQQDGSLVMQAMIGMMAQHGRLVGVGDELQAVQGFTGASSDSVKQFIQRFKPTVLPLSVCYRCPWSHLDLARQLNPKIENRPNAPKGNIEVLHPEKVVTIAQPGDLLICRFTAPLVATCLALIANGVKAMVRGRDIGSQLAAMANSVVCRFPQDFAQALTEKILPIVKEKAEAEKDAESQAMNDRYQAVMACFDSFGRDCFSLSQFTDKIQALFCEDHERPPVVLATIHRSKGDEADRVFILGSNFLPYSAKAVHEWQWQQELNLTYVALTRSKQDLFLVPFGNAAVVQTCMDHPLGGMELPDADEQADHTLAAQTLLADIGLPTSHTRDQKEAIALIEERFAAPLNNQLSVPPQNDDEPAPTVLPIAKEGKTNNGIPNGTYPAPVNPDPIYTIGMLVALYHNPRNVAKIIAMDEATVTVQQGQKEPITVEYKRIKPLIPQI